MTASRGFRQRRTVPRPGPIYGRGDVVLVPVPFPDRLAEKQRPAVVVSTERYQVACGDLIIVQLTSRTDAPAAAPSTGSGQARRPPPPRLA